MTGTRKRERANAPPGGLVALAEASRDIFAEPSWDRLTQLIADHARRIARCRYAALAIFNEKHRIRSLITSGVAKDVSDQIRALPQGKGLLGLVFDSDKPILVEDLASHPAATGFPQGHPPMKS
ncbi:MAG: GAF domain-containing protein, partial [Dehalococcoidia bacterium]